MTCTKHSQLELHLMLPEDRQNFAEKERASLPLLDNVSYLLDVHPRRSFSSMHSIY